MHRVHIFILIYFMSFSTCLYAQKNDSCRRDWIRTYHEFLSHFDSIEYYHGYDKFSRNINSSCLDDTLGFIDFLNSNYIVLNDTILINSYFAYNTNYISDFYLNNLVEKRKDSISETWIIKSTSHFKDIPSATLAMYYANSLFETSFKFRSHVQLNYKGKEIGLKPTKHEWSTYRYEIDNMKAFNKAVKTFKRWNKKLQKKGLNYMRQKRQGPFYKSYFNWD